MKLLPFVACTLVVLGIGKAQAAPKNTGPKTLYIRPYAPPENASILMGRIAELENKLGENVHTFEYSLPQNTKIILTVIARHDGVLDREKSGIFHIMRYVKDERAKGAFSFTRVFPQPLYHSDARPMWGIGLPNYGYGIFERTPKDWMYSAQLEENSIQGKAAMKDARLFAFIPDDRKFTLVINARFAPAPNYQNIESTKRYPLPLSMK